MRTIKSVIIYVLMAFMGTSAWAYSTAINVSISPGASIKIANYYSSSTTSWTAFLSTSTQSPTSGQESLNGLTISPRSSASNTKTFVTTITASDTAAIGTVVYAYARRGTSNTNGYAYKITVVDPLRLAPGKTAAGVAKNSNNAWRVGETSDPNSVISVSATGSGGSRNVNIAAAANKTGEATCWMTNLTTTAGYYAYKVYVGNQVEDIVISNMVVIANGQNAVLTNNLGQAIAWSDRTGSTSDDPDIAQVVNVGGFVAVSNTTKVGYTTVTVMTSRTNYHFSVLAVLAGIEKTVKEDPENVSNATVRITTHVNCIPPPTRENNILFLGSMCTEHGFSTPIAKQAVNTLATKGNVDWFLYGLHCSDITCWGTPYAGLPEEKYSGRVPFNQTVTDPNFHLMDSPNKISCNNLKSYLTQLDKSLDDRHENYDYIVLAFDANLLVGYYDAIPGWDYDACDKDEPALNLRVAQKLRWYYENKRIIWLHAPVKSKEPFVNVAYTPNSAIDAGTWGTDYQPPAGGWFADLNRGWEAFVAVVDPVTYLDKPHGSRYTSTTNYTYTYSGRSYKATVYAANRYELQVEYDDADEVADMIEKHVNKGKFDEEITDNIVNLNESLSVKNARFYAWVGPDAPESRITEGQVIADLPNESTDGKNYWQIQSSDSSGAYSVSTNLVDLKDELWFKYEIDIVDNGTFLDEALKHNPPYAEYDSKTGKYHVNPNDGNAKLTLYATIDGVRTPIVVEDGTLINRWVNDPEANLTLWITDHDDAGVGKIHLQFEPTFWEKLPVPLSVWAEEANASNRFAMVWGKTPSEIETCIREKTGLVPTSLRKGNASLPQSDKRVWLTVDIPPDYLTEQGEASKRICSKIVIRKLEATGN